MSPLILYDDVYLAKPGTFSVLFVFLVVPKASGGWGPPSALTRTSARSPACASTAAPASTLARAATSAACVPRAGPDPTAQTRSQREPSSSAGEILLLFSYFVQPPCLVSLVWFSFCAQPFIF